MRISPSKVLNYYYPIPNNIPEEILIKAGNRGTFLHSKIENYFDEKSKIKEFDFDEKDKQTIDLQFNNFKIEIINHEIDVKLQELNVITDKIHGFIDCICIYKNKPTIIDWKTNSQLNAESVEKYTLQMNLYRFMMKEQFNVNFEDLYIVHLTKNKSRNRLKFIKCELIDFEELEQKINEVYNFVNEKEKNE